MNSDDIGNVLLVVCFALLAFCFFGLFASCQQGWERANWKQDHHCTLTSETPTGRKVYCGKACFRDEIKRVYACDTGETIFIE